MCVGRFALQIIVQPAPNIDVETGELRGGVRGTEEFCFAANPDCVFRQEHFSLGSGTATRPMRKAFLRPSYFQV